MNRRVGVLGIGIVVLGVAAGACGDDESPPAVAKEPASSSIPSTTSTSWPGPPAPIESADISLAAETFVAHARSLYPGRVGVFWVSGHGTPEETLFIGVVELRDAERDAWESSRAGVGSFAERVFVVPTPYSEEQLNAYRDAAFAALDGAAGVAVGIGMRGIDRDALPTIVVSGPLTPALEDAVAEVVPEDLLVLEPGPPAQLL